jgi:hypothetical protein
MSDLNRSHPGDELFHESARLHPSGATMRGAPVELSPQESAWVALRWEAARDAELPAGERARFLELLSRSARLRALWRAETDWLAWVGEPEPELAADGFTGAVLEHWTRGGAVVDGLAEEHVGVARDGTVPGGGVADGDSESGESLAPLIFSGHGVMGRWPVAVAAAVAMLLTLAVFQLATEGGAGLGLASQRPRTSGGVEAPGVAAADTPSPVTALVGGFHEQFAGGANLLRRGIDTTRQALRIEGVWDLVSSVSVPDPADYVESVTQ